MKITYEGKAYDFDLDDINIGEALTIKRKLGMSLLAIEQGLTEVDPDAMRAVYWLMLRWNGEAADIDRLDFKPVKLATAVAEAALAEMKEKEAKAAEESADPKE